MEILSALPTSNIHQLNLQSQSTDSSSSSLSQQNPSLNSNIQSSSSSSTQTHLEQAISSIVISSLTNTTNTTTVSSSSFNQISNTESITSSNNTIQQTGTITLASEPSFIHSESIQRTWSEFPCFHRQFTSNVLLIADNTNSRYWKSTHVFFFSSYSSGSLFGWWLVDEL